MGVGILVEDLNAWYGTTHTLQDINLHIPANHATALIGPSIHHPDRDARRLRAAPRHEWLPRSRRRLTDLNSRRRIRSSAL